MAMLIGIKGLCATAGLGAVLVGAYQSASTVNGPPEIEQGKTVAVDFDGKGLTTGDVVQVDGNWVKLLVKTTEDKQSQGDVTYTTIAGHVVWVNFANLSYYRAPKEKKK